MPTAALKAVLLVPAWSTIGVCRTPGCVRPPTPRSPRRTTWMGFDSFGKIDDSHAYHGSHSEFYRLGRRLSEKWLVATPPKE